ncbi:MAG TPA: CHAT domain-containing protein [Thermoanaerobaculia bacterium]|nr:CHAT domain-containing protein [Thermoanaerobaculia bacterium]
MDRRDAAALSKIVRAFPADAAQLFEKSDLRDRARARLFATALATAGEHYPMAVVEAMERTRDPEALEQGLAAMKKGEYRRAVPLLERAGNPLHLAARYYASASEREIAILDPTLPHLKPEYRELASRIHSWRANLLEFDNKLFEAYADYDRALEFAKGEPTSTARVLNRRSSNYSYIGNIEAAFRDAHRAVSLLEHIADTNARNLAHSTAAMAARQLGHPVVALHYQNAAVDDVQRVVNAATPSARPGANRELVVALRARAEIHVALGQNADAEGDLATAEALAEAVDKPLDRDLFRMRIREVRGQTLLKTSPAEAAVAFSEAIELAKDQDSTYRAILHFQRATAWREAGDPRADGDLATAMAILRDEVQGALAASPGLAAKPLWDPYFSRFREMYRELIESRIADRDFENAFVYSELARAFEPMQILLQSRSATPGFRPIETVADLQQAHALLPEDTVILQYLVLPARTFTWVVMRERVVPVSQRTTRDQVDRWMRNAIAAVAGGQSDLFTKAMRGAYGELFREPLKLAGASKTRIVIVPDEPMYGFPFNGLVGTADEGYLIERASIATAGSTSLYLYALARNRQLSNDRNPPVLLVGDPAFPVGDPALPSERLVHAKEEVAELERDYYPGAEVLTDTAATVRSFLAKARNAGIIHFAGHGLASPQAPWQSRLLLAPDGAESGELSAEQLMKELPVLERTRLVVLGACSSIGGGSLGPQGLPPLVRPLIGARVPAVVGTLWDVQDASSKQLLVSLHCHYRHGDDVAVALRNAQLGMLRKQEPTMTAMHWAAFQVVGYAASPYPRPIALENPSSEHLCSQNSVHRPDGLHPQ